MEMQIKIKDWQRGMILVPDLKQIKIKGKQLGQISGLVTFLSTKSINFFKLGLFFKSCIFYERQSMKNFHGTMYVEYYMFNGFS